MILNYNNQPNKLIKFFMVYFIFFHVVTSFVNILFMGNILIWFALFPVLEFCNLFNFKKKIKHANN